ncbi:hypothetical protein [Acidovorax phage AP1]|nr:hypothetical protein [Acidovorax phage AP1]
MNWKNLKERLIDIFGGLVILIGICMLLYSVGMAGNNMLNGIETQTCKVAR